MRFLSSYSYLGNPTASTEIRGEELFYLSSDCRAATNRAALPAVQRVARNKVRGEERGHYGRNEGNECTPRRLL